MEIKAEAKHIRISPRKVRLVVDSIKRLNPQRALEHLRFINKRAARPIAKVIGSAIANAKNNFSLDPKNLEFKEIQVGEGKTLKRWRAVSRGRSHKIMKRTSHIKIVLTTSEVVESQAKRGGDASKGKLSNKKKVRKNGTKS